MASNIKVGIVEDEMIIAQGIIKVLKEIGYETCAPAVSYTAAIEMIERDKPDILLLDIVLSGHRDGIDLAWKIKEDYKIPFIFLTANADAATVERAKKVSPPAYLVKPFSKEDLYTSIEICLFNSSTHGREIPSSDQGNYFINDYLFIKQANNYIKVEVDEITHLESDRVYLTVHTSSKKWLVRSTIQNYIDLIASKNFVRIHRSFAVNLRRIDAIRPDSLLVNGNEIPIGKAFRDDLLSILKIG